MEYHPDDSDPYFLEANEPHSDPYINVVYGMPKEEWLDKWFPFVKATTRVSHYFPFESKCLPTFSGSHILAAVAYSAVACTSAMVPCRSTVHYDIRNSIIVIDVATSHQTMVGYVCNQNMSSAAPCSRLLHSYR